MSSFCMAVPRDAPLRWDESYGGEDGVFCADALAAGIPLVFDPRFVARHDHGRESFEDLRGQQRRLAYGLARLGPVQREGAHKRVLARVPIHYFALLRLPVIFRRLDSLPELRARFVHHPAAPGRRRVDARRERCPLRAAAATAARAARHGIPVGMALPRSTSPSGAI